MYSICINTIRIADLELESYIEGLKELGEDRESAFLPLHESVSVSRRQDRQPDSE